MRGQRETELPGILWLPRAWQAAGWASPLHLGEPSCWWARERTVYEQLMVLKAWQPRQGSIWEAVYAASRGCLGAGRSQLLLLVPFPGGLEKASSPPGRRVFSLLSSSPRKPLRHPNPAWLLFFSCEHPTPWPAFQRLVVPETRISFSLSQTPVLQFPQEVSRLP